MDQCGISLSLASRAATDTPHSTVPPHEALMLHRAPTFTGRRLTPLVRRRLQNQGHDGIKNGWMMLNMGRELGSIEHQALEPCGEQVTSASPFDFLCSYSWKGTARGTKGIDSRQLQIYVPGELLTSLTSGMLSHATQ